MRLRIKHKEIYCSTRVVLNFTQPFDRTLEHWTTLESFLNQLYQSELREGNIAIEVIGEPIPLKVNIRTMLTRFAPFLGNGQREVIVPLWGDIEIRGHRGIGVFSPA